MDFKFSEKEEAFRQEVRDWLQKEIPKRWIELDPGWWEETDESWAVACEFQKKLGDKGWLAPAYPKEYGGAEMSQMERLILSEELAYHRAPVGVESDISVNWVGPTIQLYGTPEQKEKYVTGVAKGDIHFCLGYSEPNAGSDLAGLMTRAVEDGDSYIVNGQKVWTSFGHYADYCWLGARTDPDAPKHKGISMFVVDMKTPGITVRPIINILHHHSFNEVFFEDVRVPKENLVGTKNGGWYQLAVALDFERSGVSMPAGNQRMIDELLDYAKHTKRNGKLLIEDPIIRHKLAGLVVDNEVLRMLCYRIACMYDKGLHPNYEASTTAMLGSEFIRRMANTAMKILGPYGQLTEDSKETVLHGRVLRMFLACLSIGIGGGTTEIQKNIIAMRGLGLPRK